MPGPGRLGGPGLPGRVRIGKAQVTSNAVMEQDSMGHFISEIRRSGDTLMRRLADDWEDRAKHMAPVRTGRLRDDLQVFQSADKRELRLVTNVPYAVVMEEGSRPHLIHGVRANFTMKNGRRFVWNDPRYGPAEGPNPRGYYRNWTDQYGATVRHPGTKAKKFMYRSWKMTFEDARIKMRQVYG